MCKDCGLELKVSSNIKKEDYCTYYKKCSKEAEKECKIKEPEYTRDIDVRR